MINGDTAYDSVFVVHIMSAAMAISECEKIGEQLLETRDVVDLDSWLVS